MSVSKWCFFFGVGDDLMSWRNFDFLPGGVHVPLCDLCFDLGDFFGDLLVESFVPKLKESELQGDFNRDDELEIDDDELVLSTSFNDPLSLITGLSFETGLHGEGLFHGLSHIGLSACSLTRSIDPLGPVLGSEVELADFSIFFRRFVGGEDLSFCFASAAVRSDSHRALLMAASSAGRMPPMSFYGE